MFRFENKPSSSIMQEKKSYRCMSGKKILSPEVWEKNLLIPKQNHPYPPSKVKWSVPNFYHVRYRLSL